MKELMPDGNKRLYLLKQTCSCKLKFCSSIYDLLLPPVTKELNPQVDLLQKSYVFIS